MKRLALLLFGLLLVAAAAIIASCGENPDSIGPAGSTTTATTAVTTASGTATTAVATGSSCVNCHTDKTALLDTVSEVVAAAPEEASGEG